jgi:hypothetical protein
MRAPYPLQWPEGWPRTRHPAAARFKVSSFAYARDRVLQQVRQLGGTRGVITSNLPTRLDGLPYANASEPADRGIAVYWVEQGRERVMACDRWRSTRDNLHAIELSLDALRGLARWGSSAIVERAFAGFAALPPSGEHDWRVVFGWVGIPRAELCLDDLKHRFRELAAAAHPDRGGDDHQMQRLNAAYAAAKLELEGPR